MRRFARQIVLRWLTLVSVACLCASDLVAEEPAASGYGANQPYSSYWHIEDLLTWNPQTDPHLPFNVSSTPLATRFVYSATQRNPELSTDPRVMTLVSAHPTSNHPSQGFPDELQYVFPFWQYVDHFVMWGGSAGEGLVVTPSLPWIDAAHRNGTKIYGTVFFPPTEFGGRIEWFQQALQQEEPGVFPVVDKLIEVAELYGFDGWFLNQETQGATAEEALLMQQWLDYYQSQASGRFELIWYDAMTKDGVVDWQEELNENNLDFFQSGQHRRSDLMFLDFGWKRENLRRTSRNAGISQRSPWELFAGIDVQIGSYYKPVRWNALYDNGRPTQTSVALYWPSSTRDVAKVKSQPSFHAEERRFWNGHTVEHPKFGKRRWRGFADYFPARSVISQVPFVTRFNYGAGEKYFLQGECLSEQPWHNLSNQDILPTWQWRCDPAQLRPIFDFDRAYCGGSSLRIDSKLQQGEHAELLLYKTNLAVEQDTIVRVVCRRELGDTAATLTLVFKGKEEERVNLPLQVKANGQWETSVHELNEFTGETIAAIGLSFLSGKVESSLLLGELAVVNQDSTLPDSPVAELELFESPTTAEAYLNIKNAKRDAIWYHDVYNVMTDGALQWLGRSSSSDCYIASIPRPQTAMTSKLAVVATNKAGVASKPTLLEVEWSNESTE